MLIPVFCAAVVPIITVLQEPTAVSESDSVEFSCYAVGTPPPTISWEFQGKTVATGNTLTIGNAPFNYIRLQ